MADGLKRMRLKGTRRYGELLSAAGGTVSPTWLSKSWGISEETVLQSLEQSELLALRSESGEWMLPVFQFDEVNKCLIKGLPEFLSHTKTWRTDEK